MDQDSHTQAAGPLSRIVAEGAKTLGIPLPQGAIAAFEKYYALLELRRQSVNLTAISGAEDVARLHFLDSLAPLNAADFKDTRVIDVGSGAGFPGIPLKIAQPSIALTLLDATAKRIAFMEELCAALGVDAAFIHARAEETAHDPDFRERFDVAISRAVAELRALSELCLPFVRVGGVFLAMKGPGAQAETADSQIAIKTLGATLEGQYNYTIPETNVALTIVIIRKTSPTPVGYPRRANRIKKKPL